MKLWIHWCNAIWLLRPACSRLRTFLWFATCVAGLTVRTDLLGVTSIVRTVKPATQVANHRKVRRREQAGRNSQIALHQ